MWGWRQGGIPSWLWACMLTLPRDQGGLGELRLSGWILDLVWLKPPTDPQAAALLLEAKAWLPPFSWARDAFPVVLSELCFCAGLGPDLKRWERSGSVISDPH